MESQSQLKKPQQHMTELDREDVDVHEHGGVQKQSVLEKVKAKARKIKDTIKKHGHHHPDHDQGRDDQPRENRPAELRHEDDEEEDENEEDVYEEMENDPEVHGAPIYDSQVATSTSTTPNQGLMQHQPNMERTDEQGKDNAKLGVPTCLELTHHQPNVERIVVPTSHGAEEFKPELEKKTENASLMEDVEAPRNYEASRPGNHEVKVSDPTGAETLDKMSTAETERGSCDQVESDHDKVSAGSRDQSESGRNKYRDMPDDSPLITGESVEQDISLQGGGCGEELALATKDAAASKLGGYEDEKIDKTDDHLDQTNQPSYAEKASQVASLLADKAVGVKDAVASKLGYGGTEEHKTPREPVDHEALLQQSGYMGKVSGATSAIADKAVEAKNVVASKLGYDQTSDSASSTKPTDADRASGEESHPTESSKWAEKLKPGDEEKALSELITGSVFKGSSPRQENVSDQKGELLSDSKVTESEDVAGRFGTSEEEKKGDLTKIRGSESPKKAVVDMIKGAVSSLWSGGVQTLTHPQTGAIQTDTQPEADQSNAEVRRLQESAN